MYMQRDSFTFRKEWRDALSGLSNEVKLEVYDAIMEYGFSGTLSSLKPMAMLAFNFVKSAIDADNDRINEIRRRRSEAGKKGGAPRGNSNASKTSKTSKNKQNKHLLDLDALNTNNNSDVVSSKPLYTDVFQEENKQNKQNKQMLDLGCLDDKKQLLKESTLFPLDEEIPPITPIEVNPPIIPQESTNTVKRTRAKFVKPTILEVKEYIEQKGYDVDPVVFWNFYEANGWVQGRQQKPIKNWKACVTTWIRNPQYSRNYGTTQTTQQAYQTSEYPTDSELRSNTIELIQRLSTERHARNAKIRERQGLLDESDT